MTALRVAVVGVGGAGSAALRFLAEAGHRVVGYEQFGIGHDRGSSHGESRIIRYTYPDPLYTGLMADAYPLWAALEEEAGEELQVRCGGLYIGPREHPEVRATEAALAGARLPYDVLDPDAVRERFPAFRLAACEVALHQRDSGFLRATRCVRANVRLAEASGATVRAGTAVEAIEQRQSQVFLRTAAGEEAAFDRVIVTAGAWMGKLLAGLNLPLQVTCQSILYLTIRREPEQFAPGRFPIWIDAGRNWYGFPSDGQIEGAKLALHDRGVPLDPDGSRPGVAEGYLSAAAAYAADRLPDVSLPATWAQTCLYTNTPDEDFILDRVAGMQSVWMVSGCSGHGFKFTVLLGKIAALLATGEEYPRDLSRFSLARFGARAGGPV